jgi:hypothetical protein
VSNIRRAAWKGHHMSPGVVLEVVVPIPAIGARRGDRITVCPDNQVTLGSLKPSPIASAPLRLVRGGAR